MKGRSTFMLGRTGGGFRLVLALAGIAGIVAALVLVPLLLTRAPAGPERAALTAFAVTNPAGARIGTLRIDYDRALAENEDGTIALEYRAAADRPEWRRGFAGASQLRLEAFVDAARLTIVPAPARHLFSNARIVRTGADRRVWTFAPQAEGTYRLLVRLAAEPEGFSVGRVAVNDALLDPGRQQEIPLEVRVTTRYLVSQAWVDAARLATGFLSFLLTLPAAAILLQRFRARPAPAPAAPAPRRPARAKPARRKRPPGR